MSSDLRDPASPGLSPWAPPQSRLGALQRGRGDGFRAALAGGPAKPTRVSSLPSGTAGRRRCTARIAGERKASLARLGLAAAGAARGDASGESPVRIGARHGAPVYRHLEGAALAA